MVKAKPKAKLNEAKSEVIQEEILKESTEELPEASPNELGIPDDDGIVAASVVSKIPEMRRIVFLNGRDPGYPLEFHYHSKTHPLKQYKLLHGHEYDLPVEIIDHLEGCNEPQYAYRNGPDGHPEMYTKGKKFIFQCRNAPKKTA
jgi:hypothetical protein